MSLVDVSELFSDPEFMRTVSLRRPTIHYANEGEAIQSSDADVAFLASVQPARADDVQRLMRDGIVPEGERGSGRIVVIYSSTELRMSGGKTDIADVVVVPAPDPGEFRVVGTEPWGPHGYYKSLAVEMIP